MEHLQYTTAVPEPTSDQVKRACLNAIQYEEWELVREYVNRLPRRIDGDGSTTRRQ